MSTRFTLSLCACRRRLLALKSHLPAIGFVALLCAPHVIEMPGSHSLVGSLASDLVRMLGFAIRQGLVGRSTRVRSWLAKSSGTRTMGQETATRKQDAGDRAGR